LEVNEKTFCYIPITFLDENKSPVTPTNVTTRIDDVASGTNIRPVTSLVVTSPNVSVLVTSNENRIVNDTDEDQVGEIHLLTIECDIPHGHVTGQHEIYVKNLPKVTSP
jgi:hypothetical protein